MIFFYTGHPLFQGVSHVLSHCPIILSYLPCVILGPPFVLASFQSTPRDLYRRLIFIQQVIGGEVASVA